MSSSGSGYARRSRDDHHWYWVAAIPVIFCLWLAALAWLAVASSFETFGFGGSTVELSMVAVGVPFVFLTLYFPLAVYRDASYIDRTSGNWAPEPRRKLLQALPGAVLLVVSGAFVLFFGGSLTWPIIAGFVVDVPFAVQYLRERRKHVGQPELPWR